MYKYILWDVDGTVLDFIKAEANAIKSLFKKYNLGECTDAMIKDYSAINAKYWKMLERNEITKPQVLMGRFIEFFEALDIDTSIAESFNRDYQLALGDTIEFCPHAMETLLSQKGKYTLVAVTNGTKVAQDKKLRLSGLHKVFDYIFISEDVGFEKPNIEYFNYVFNELGITHKSEVIIIGDSLTGDMRGGNNAGIDTCWYNPSHKENDIGVNITFEIDDLSKINDIISAKE